MSAADRLAEIEARANAATDGPWLVDEGLTDHVVNGSVDPESDDFWLVEAWAGDADAEFIAHARTDVPALVAALRAVLAIHAPAHIYPLLDVPGNPPDTDAEPLVTFCQECTPADTQIAVEDWTWDDGMPTVSWPCRSVNVIESALGGGPDA